MAKSQRTKRSRFYTAISRAKLPATLQHLKITVPLPKITVPAVNRTHFYNLGADGIALLHDTGLYLRLGLAQFVSKQAKILYALAAIAVVATGTAVAVQIAVATTQKYSRDISNPAMLMNKKNTGTTIVDRNGVVLFQAYGAVDRHSIPFNEMPSNIKQATLATEDPNFYNHPGFSWRATARAAFEDIVHSGKVQGGSTITQQLVKDTLLTNEKSFIRKYQEVLLSTEMEQRYSKDQILQMYLNTIYYGEGAYGIEAASETYFHKPAKDLTLEESALLAGLPQSPSRFDPNVDPQAAKQRRDYVLERMHEQGYITATVAGQTQAKPIVAGTRQIVLRAPHFVFYVLDQLRQQYGENAIEHGGLTVHTTLDYAKQQKAEEIVKKQVDNLASHHVTNGGLVSINPHNGDIVTMVGSVDYDQPGFGAVNVTLAQLQPGSSFKPIAYVTAFTKGWNGATKVDDKPMVFPQADGSAYIPQNYDLKFRGPVTLRRALANSLNIPAIQVLQHAGLPDTISMAHNLGIQAPSLTDTGRYGLSLVLGGGEVRPIDMASVYADFANNGATVTPRAITSVNDRFGNDITKKPHIAARQALDTRIAYMITNILSDNNARKEEFGENSPLKLSRPAAAKTGTTNDFRDNWTVGYTPDLVTAVWVGNNDHTPMYNVDGITGAAPIWHDYMEMALAGTPVHDFTVPAGVVFARVCPTDGGLAGQNDPNGYTEVFLAGTQPTKPCGWSGSVTPTIPTYPTPVPQAAPTTPIPIEAKAPLSPTQPGMGGGSPTPNPNPGSSTGGGNSSGGNSPPTPTPTPSPEPSPQKP